MNRFFNTAGPCVPGEHYLLDASERLREVSDLIRRRQYFVIHAARQSGKTTLLLDLRSTLQAGGRYHALYCSLEGLQGVPDPTVGIPALVEHLRLAVSRHAELAPAVAKMPGDAARWSVLLLDALSVLCEAADKPLVLLFDEVDCLSEGTLISFLRQLRDGFVNRAGGIPFPSSVALVGMRNVRDYKARVRPEGSTLGSASPFNIAAESMRLENFTAEEVGALYSQHTADTGQVFPSAAVERAHFWSQGQPWLVNALAREVVDKMLRSDYSEAVAAEMFDEAAERLILRRDTHIDSLIERLREERVRRIVEPVLLGSERTFDLLSDNCRYVLDLGLLRADRGRLEAANPIYREVIIRSLNYSDQFALQDKITNRWMADGKLDMNGLLRVFQQFWRENADIWIEKYDYKEAAPHLILMAFLQRVVNGGAHIDREFALGRKRLDLCVMLDPHRYPVELKLRRGARVEEEGLIQLGEYMDTCGAAEGWLVIFDRDSDKSWDERIFWRTVAREHRTIHIVGA